MADDDRDGPGTALAVRAPVPPLVLAKDLAAATPRSFVHIDRKGQVRSPARFKAIQAGAYATIGGSILLLTILYGAMFGIPGAAVGLGLGALFTRNIGRVRKIQKAARLIVHDRVDEAEALLAPLAARGSRRVRAMAEQNLAACELRRGRYAEALAYQRAAIALHGRARRRSPFQTMVELGEVTTLVNLDRVKEARELFDRRHATVPEGDFLRIHHWAAELYVAMAEGKHAIDADELHDRARIALGMSSGVTLLALCAWAHRVGGDEDLAWHLLREAIDRRGDLPIDRLLPRLHAWMEANAAAAQAAAGGEDW